MKTFFTLLLSLVPAIVVFGQCPSAGQDSAVSYCKNEFFDVEELRSSDADTNGVFIDPWGDTMTNTVTSLAIPGMYSYFYHVSDTSCPVDTAKYVITIVSFCWGGVSEPSESTTIIQTNPVRDHLILKDDQYDQLEIIDLSGRSILIIPPSSSTTIPVSQLESGNYLLIRQKNGIRQFQRFLKY